MKEEENAILAAAKTALAFEETMQEYIATLKLHSVADYNHFTLHLLHNRFGETTVNGWLKKHFDNK